MSAAQPRANEQLSRDFRVIGAVVAFGLDAALLLIAALLVFASVSEAWSLVLAGTIGLVVAPFLGWRYGPRAVISAQDSWPLEALATLILVDGTIVAGRVFQTVVDSNSEGSDLPALVAYVILNTAFLTAALTGIVGLPIGIMWSRVLRWMGGQRLRA